MLLLFLIVLSFSKVSAQDEITFDEIPVFITVPKVGGFEITAVISGEDLYLPVTDLFNFLKIRNVPDPNLETVSGFFIDPQATYLVSRKENSIKYQDKVFSLGNEDLIRTETNLYLRSDYFGRVFGLNCNFSFRTLSATMNSKLELPLIREMRQQAMRENLTLLKGEVVADTTVRREYPAFRAGTADWSAISTQEPAGISDLRLNLSMEAMIAGGEATASLTYNSTDPLSSKQQYFLWRYVDNERNLFRQVMAGRIATQSVSTVFNPVIGVQFTNTPTTYRRSFGSYTLNDRTEPGWIVELYVNNILVDYAKADASGSFRFEVPLVYGNSLVQLRFYGPWGEEKVREQNITIPFNFLPEKVFEYRASAGIVEDSSMSRFSRISMNYGIARKLTIGGGLEYLSSVTSGPVMPYAEASWSILNNLLFSGEYTYGVRSKGTLSYRLPSNIQVDFNYTRYTKGQTAIFYNYLEERKLSISLPLRIRKFTSYNRFSLNQIVLPLSDYTTGEWMFSGSLLGLNTNVSTFALFIEKDKPYVYSNFSASVRLPKSFILRPQVQYGYNENQLMSVKIGLEKPVKDKAYFNLSYEQNVINNIRMAEAGFRYNFGFAQTGFSLRQTGKRSAFVEYARGSLIYDRKTGYLGTDNNSNVGKGGISVVPYLDLNGNGRRDHGEPKAFGLNLKVNGGEVDKNDRDTTIRILNLEPYTNCFIELDENSFDNVSWRLPVRTWNVAVNPGIIKDIEIPVMVVGEASGTISIDKGNGLSGLGRIIMRFYDKKGKQIGTSLSEDDGYYTYFGIKPGEYYVIADTVQLSKLGMVSDPVTRKFNIKPGIEGDLTDGLDFRIRMMISDVPAKSLDEKQSVKRDTSYILVHEVTQELVTITKDSWSIQIGAFRDRSNAEKLRRNLDRLLRREVEIIIEDGLFKVRINEISERPEAENIIRSLKNNGITELWLIRLKAKHQQLVTTERQDSMMTVEEMKRFMSFGKDFYKLNIKEGSAIKPVILDMMEADHSITKPSFSELPSLPKEKQDETIILNMGERPVVSIPERAETNMIIPGFFKKISGTALIANKTKRPASVNMKGEPVISLQVAVFSKKSEALRAQRRISSKLKVHVEIIQQWDYYRVIIPGFYNREETYRFYPDLAGLGYPGPSLIEE
jgi:hypothetical protein